MSTERSDRRWHRAEATGTTAAGAAGTMLGAVKLRDEFKHDYPGHFARGTATATEHADAVAPRAGRLARAISEGRPRMFIPLAVGTAGGLTAAGARRHRKRHPVAKSAFGVEYLTKGQPEPLQQIDVVDAKVRKLKRKTIPTVPQLLARAGDQTRAIVSRESTMSKADKRKAAELGLGTGSVVAGAGSLRASQERRGHLKAAASSSAARDRNFEFGRRNMNEHAGKLADTVKNKRQRKAVTIGALEDHVRDAHYARGKYQAGQRHASDALRSTARAGQSLRHARGLRATAVGLGAGALLAHRHASRDH